MDLAVDLPGFCFLPLSLMLALQFVSVLLWFCGGGRVVWHGPGCCWLSRLLFSVSSSDLAVRCESVPDAWKKTANNHDVCDQYLVLSTTTTTRTVPCWCCCWPLDGWSMCLQSIRQLNSIETTKWREYTWQGFIFKFITRVNVENVFKEYEVSRSQQPELHYSLFSALSLSSISTAPSCL